MHKAFWKQADATQVGAGVSHRTMDIIHHNLGQSGAQQRHLIASQAVTRRRMGLGAQVPVRASVSSEC